MPSNYIFGGCPKLLSVKAALQSGTPAMIGYAGFIAPTDGHTPPDFWRKYECDGGWTYTQTLSGHPTETIVGAGIGASNIGWNADGTSLSGTNDSTETVTNSGNATNGPTVNDRVIASIYGIFSSPTPGVYADSFTGVDNPNPSLGPPNYGNTVTLAVTSNTNISLTQAGWSYGGATMGGGSVDFILYDQDLEADAVTRATLSSTSITAGPVIADIFAAGIYSLWEDRYGNDVAQFSYAAGTFQLNLQIAIGGVPWIAKVQFEQLVAAGDGTGDQSHYGTTWADCELVPVPFTPTAGPYSTPATDIPVAEGYQKRIKSVRFVLAT